MIKSPILLTGIERSGTTIVARILQSCRVWHGNCSVMMENKPIRQLMDYYYISQQADPNGQYPLVATNHDMPVPDNWRNDIEESLMVQGYVRGNWFLKSSRLIHIWPLMNKAYPDAKWLIVRRRSGDIIESCMKTGFMKAYKNSKIREQIGIVDEREAWAWWIHQHENQLVEMIKAGLNVKVIWPDRMIEGDYAQMAETLDWLGLRWNEKIVPIVEDQLIKGRTNKR